ncbi:hypothetical protein [Hyphomicrobium sp.]|uniref:hypothetical protein n=1 Tax=Hyphomicrobium sp. TaxID=82 RepID=UPI0025B8B9A9|nr:hypothetical protein [Hyphomicrobium sp.]MCC7253950.1 hypothetical protein [Hyphomicrobium sp.]
MSFIPETPREIYSVLAGIFISGLVVNQFFVPVAHWGKWIQDSEALVAEALGEGPSVRQLKDEVARYKDLYEKEAAAAQVSAGVIAELKAEVEAQKSRLGEADKAKAELDQAKAQIKKLAAKPKPARLPEQDADFWIAKNSAELLFDGLVVVTWLGADDRSCKLRIADDDAQPRDVLLEIGAWTPIQVGPSRLKMILRSVQFGATCSMALSN